MLKIHDGYKIFCKLFNSDQLKIVQIKTKEIVTIRDKSNAFIVIY